MKKIEMHTCAYIVLLNTLRVKKLYDNNFRDIRMQLPSVFKKGYIFVFLGFLLLAFSVVPFYAFIPPCAYWEIRGSLADGEWEVINIGYFIRDSFVKTMIYVWSGDGEITAYVLYSSSPHARTGVQTILQQGRVNGSGAFHFEVPNDGYYNLHLENDFNQSGKNNEQFLVKIYYYFYSLLFWLSAVTMLTLGFALLVYHKVARTLRRLAQQKKEMGNLTLFPDAD